MVAQGYKFYLQVLKVFLTCLLSEILSALEDKICICNVLFIL